MGIYDDVVGQISILDMTVLWILLRAGTVFESNLIAFRTVFFNCDKNSFLSNRL